MAKNGQPAGIVALLYESQLHRSLPVEVLVRSEVLARYPERYFTPLHRHSFHLLVVCTAGSGQIGVDFDDVDLREGSVVLVRPGQLMQHHVGSRYEALWVVYPDIGAPSDLRDQQSRVSTGPTRWDLPATDADVIKRIVLEMRDEQRRFDGSREHAMLLEAQLRVLLARLRLLTSTPVDSKALPKSFLAYAERLDERYHVDHSVGSYARGLGYSARTLSRACQQVCGKTAKQVLDERIVLEAKRRLAHTEDAGEQIARRLGFADPSHFARFFRRLAGVTPAEFRISRHISLPRQGAIR